MALKTEIDDFHVHEREYTGCVARSKANPPFQMWCLRRRSAGDQRCARSTRSKRWLQNTLSPEGWVKVNVDWEIVKKQTLWSYEDLIKKLLGVLTYDFVQEHYNHTMVEAQVYAMEIRRGYLQDRGDMTAYIDTIAIYLAELETHQIGTYSYLVHQVTTREDCVAFLQRIGFDFDHLIQTLNYLLRWVLPFKTPLREFIDVDNDTEIAYLEVLKKQSMRSNLDFLEVGRREAGRINLSSATGIPMAFIIPLVHKADISRLAYVRGKTVRHLCGGGYDSLDKIASADLAEMETKMDAYYKTLGKSLADFRAVIPLAWMIGGAKTLPRVVRDC